MPVMLRHIGRPLAFYMTNVGKQNCVTQLWAFDSIADYETRQAAVEADPAWHDYLREVEGIIRYRESRLTRRISFAAVDQAPNFSYRKPVVDFRTYQIRYHKMPLFLSTTKKFAMRVMLRHIGPPIGYYLTAVSNLQFITHMWGYDGMGDMETRRNARNADPEWKAYLDSSDGIYENQDTRLLVKLKLFDDE